MIGVPIDLNKSPDESGDLSDPDRVDPSLADERKEEAMCSGEDSQPFGGDDYGVGSGRHSSGAKVEYLDDDGGDIDVPEFGDPPDAFGSSDGDAKASNRVDVEVCSDDENYKEDQAIDSEDDRPVPRLSQREIALLRSLFPGRDPLVAECVDLSQSHRAVMDFRYMDLEMDLAM